jgi:tRNA 2-thiouridine synthesizing protein B
VLHLINHSPWEQDSLQTCLRLAGTGSAILLYENGVYAALRNTSISECVTESRKTLRWYVLEPDLSARGIEAERLIDGIELIDYHGFVNLVTEHQPVQSWL